MKVKVKSVPSKFTPREITITIESEQELCNLWLRTRLHPSSIDESASKCNLDNVIHDADNSDSEFHNMLDELVDLYNLDKKKD